MAAGLQGQDRVRGRDRGPGLGPDLGQVGATEVGIRGQGVVAVAGHLER